MMLMPSHRRFVVYYYAVQTRCDVRFVREILRDALVLVPSLRLPPALGGAVHHDSFRTPARPSGRCNHTVRTSL